MEFDPMWSICCFYFLLTILFFLTRTSGIWNGFRSPVTTQLTSLSRRYNRNADITLTYIDYTTNGLILSKGGISVLVQTNSSRNITYKLLPSSRRSIIPNRGSISFHGLVGIYNLPTGMYVLLIRESEPASFVPPFRLYKATAFEFVKIPVAHQSQQERLQLLLVSPVEAFKLRQKQAFVEELLLTTMRKHHFYFSDAMSGDPYDVSSSFQENFLHLVGNYNEKAGQNRTHLQDDRYFWNAASSAGIRAVAGDKLVTKLCSGFLSSFSFRMHDIPIQYFLLSRRRKTRQGPRYIKRGVDANAEVANFVETEQVVIAIDDKSKTKISAFRQIRGSIPLHWNQPETWKLRPPIILDANEQSDSMDMKQHLEHIYQQYCSNNNNERDHDNLKIRPSQLFQQKRQPIKNEPNIYLINLIDKKGSQGELGRRWLYILYKVFFNKEPAITSLTDRSSVTVSDFSSEQREVQSSHNNVFQSLFVRFLWLDYHYHVKNFGVEALRIIHKLVLPALTSSRGGFFLASDMNSSALNPFRSKTVRLQTKLIRTNCVDCLDRTNVVQTVIGRWALIQQLGAVMNRVSVASSNSLALPSTELEEKFRVAWADTGDHLSTLYAGSRAMKRDVTRTGKRTRRGMVDDAFSFAQRYVANNYQDSTFQKAIDFLLGLHENSDALFDKEFSVLDEEEDVDGNGQDGELINTNVHQYLLDELLQQEDSTQSKKNSK